MKEQSIENRLKKEIEKLGGMALKFTSPGVTGVPDRIILLPHERVVFIELKAPGKKPKPRQKYIAKKLKFLGFKVEVIDNIEGVKDFIKEVSC